MSCDALRRLEEHDGILELAQESVTELQSEGLQVPADDATWQNIQDVRDRLAERRLELIQECPDASPQEARTA